MSTKKGNQIHPGGVQGERRSRKKKNLAADIRRCLSDIHFGGNTEKDKTIILDKTTNK